jgi:ElaA protein
VIRSATFDELDARTLYAVLKLRAEVFVVEQACAYLDPDDDDLDATHLWLEEDGELVAYLRIIGGNHIGRVVTRASDRGRGHGRTLMATALEMTSRPVHIKAQSRLESWYEAFGFVPAGEPFLDDGIPHTPMTLP